jgi:hypothetical protein
VGTSQKRRQAEVRLSNSFTAIGKIKDKEIDEDEINLRTPITFLDVFEQALFVKDKGKRKVREYGEGTPVERGFSPTSFL